MSGKLAKADIKFGRGTGPSQGGLVALTDADSALKAFLAEPDGDRSSQLLTQLLCRYAHPLAKEIIASRLGRENALARTDPDFHDIEDVCNEVAIQLLNRLRRIKASASSEFLTDFRAYVAVSAYNACHHYLRRKYPERYRLKNRLRYVLTRDGCFALWETSGRWFCGLSEWRGKRQTVPDEEVIHLIRNHSDLVAQSSAVIEGELGPARALLEVLFVRIQSPVEFDILVGELLSASPQPGLVPITGSSSNGATIGRDHAAVIVSPEVDRVDQQLYLQRVWSEIEALPAKQRAALLLNLRDPQGQELLTLLTEARGASLTQMADALGISTTRVAELWGRLPIDDAQIAQELGVTRQQVINLRLSARRRLARRMNRGE
ncbi:MAG TPA: hypothetical protein VI756_13090 [Blastocatellia bacterium]